MYVTKNLLKLDIFFIKKCISFFSLGKATFLRFNPLVPRKKTQEWRAVEVFIVFFFFKTFSLIAFACHPESIVLVEALIISSKIYL